MGTIAEKLTYLNTTKEKIRDSINLTGANIGTSDTFRSYASKLKKGYIDIINNGTDTLYNNFPKVSGIGSNLSLAPTYEAPIKLNEIQGDTLQDGTPTPDTPVEIESVTGNQEIKVTGKNLFDKDNTSITSGAYINSSTGEIIIGGTSSVINNISVISNTTYTLTAVGTNKIAFYDSNNNYLSNITSNLTTFTTPANCKYIKIQLATETLDVNSIQLEKGSQATTYEPYQSATYELNLGNIELNKISTYEDRIRKSTGKNIITTFNYASSGYINYNYDNSKAEKTMTYSFIPNISTKNVTLYIRANTSISSYNVGIIPTITSGTKVSITFTLTDEQYNTIKNTTGGYIQVYKSGVSMDENSISNPMLEKGSTASPYEPYGKVWYVEKNIDKVVLDGSETWSYNGVNLIFVTNDLVDYLKTDFIPYSNYYQGQSVTLYNQVENNHISFLQSTTQNRLLIKNLDYTDVTAFKTWLSNNNTTIYYVLNTPTTTEITNTELIEDLETLYTAKSQEGTTNISITSEDLEMILNISALMKGDA